MNIHTDHPHNNNNNNNIIIIHNLDIPINNQVNQINQINSFRNKNQPQKINRH